MTLAYISSLKILSFQNSKYFEIPLLINLSFSTNFETSLPQIGKKEHALEFHQATWGDLDHPTSTIKLQGHLWGSILNMLKTPCTTSLATQKNPQTIERDACLCVQPILQVHLSNNFEPKI
jgi:hypothetical protein